MDPAALDALPLFAPAGQLMPEVHVVTRWDGGYQGTVTVTNLGQRDADGWTLRLYLPDGWTITDSPGVRVVDTGAGLRADPGTPDLRHIDAGGQVVFDLTVSREAATRPAPAAVVGGGFAPRWMGFNLASWWHDTFGSRDGILSLANLAATGANMVAIVPTRFLEDQQASEIFETEHSEPDANVIAMIRAARDLGLQVALKPHLDPVGFTSRQRIQPSDPDRFFANFQAMMVHYARMAQAEGAALFVVGTELVDLTQPQHEQRWRRLIAAVRAVYDGPMTYAANYGEELTVPFWDALDYIGVDMYAPLMTDNLDPTVDDVVTAWLTPPRQSFTRSIYGDHSLVEALADLSVRYDRPILFTEIGFRSVDGAGTSEAILHPETKPVDEAEQAVFYEGFARAMIQARADWLAGVLFWDWSVEPAVAGQPAPDPRGHSVAGKPAEAVFRKDLAPLTRAQTRPGPRTEALP